MLNKIEKMGYWKYLDQNPGEDRRVTSTGGRLGIYKSSVLHGNTEYRTIYGPK